MQVSAYRQFFKRIGLLSCGVVFLTGLQFFQAPVYEPASVHLQDSDTLHPGAISDAVLEEAREGEYRVTLGVVAQAAFTGILRFVSSSLCCRELPFRQIVAQSLHSSRAPPVI